MHLHAQLVGIQIEDLEDDVRSGYSSSLGRIRIISVAEYERLTSYWVKEWLIFLVGSALVTVLPMMRWVSAKKAATGASASVKKRKD
jgi:hypothetical protein